MAMKAEEFLALQQGDKSVMEYVANFNHLSQYATEHVNTDKKKKACFMGGLNTKLQTMMTTCQNGTYYEAVNISIASEKRTENTKKQRRRPLLHPSLVAVKSARGSLITHRATDAFQRHHLFVVPFLLHNIDLGSRSILDLLPSPLHHASRTPQVFLLLLRQTTIILATIVVSLSISLKNAPTLDKITPLSKGHPSANPNRASLKMGLRKDRVHKGVNLQKR